MACKSRTAMKIICFVNQKGGVGKTTSVMNIGAGMTKLGKKVLLIDLDPQESLSYWLGVTEPEKTIFDFFDGKESLESCIMKHANGFDVIPSKEMLATITPDVYQLKQALFQLDYDFVLLDCSPTLGMTSLAALTASHWVIIPLCPDLLSIKGMSQLLGTIQTIREQTNSAIMLKSVIATRFDSNQRMHRDVLEQLDAFFNGVPIYTVREDISVSESPVAGLSVMDYKPDSTGAEDYMTITKGLLVDDGYDFRAAVSKVLTRHTAAIRDNAPKSSILSEETTVLPPVILPTPEKAENGADFPSTHPEQSASTPAVFLAQKETQRESETPSQPLEQTAIVSVVPTVQEETPSESEDPSALSEQTETIAGPQGEAQSESEEPSEHSEQPIATSAAIPAQEDPAALPSVPLSRCQKKHKIPPTSPSQERKTALGLKAAIMLGIIVAATAIMVYLVQSSPKIQEPAVEQTTAQQAAEQPSAQQTPLQQPPPQQPPAPTPPPAAKPEKTVLKGVQFDYDKDTLQPQSIPHP